MAASKSGVNIVADTRSLSRLARDLRRAAPEAWKAYRVAVRVAAQPVLEDARQRALTPGKAKGSQGAPLTASSLRIRVTSGGNVKIQAGGDRAPAAAAIENKGKGFVRHPVGGDRENWTDKNSLPAFLAPAFDAHKERVMHEIEDAVVLAVERAIKERAS